MDNLRGGLIGCGFFAQNHLHAWREVSGAEIVAACDLDEARVRTCARKFDIRGAYTDILEMLQTESLDFVDIATQATTHRSLVEAAARHGVEVICQKPLAPTLEEARATVEACRAANVRLMVHENFRWQTPMRALKEAAQDLGELFYGRISFRSAYDVYADQPYLAEDQHFILYDLGVHLLDLARFFLGEVQRLYCQTQRVNPQIAGEDVATVLLEMTTGATCVVEMSYASKLEEELFPQTLVHLEGAKGSAILGPRYRLTVVKDDQVDRRVVSPKTYSWSTPPGEVVQDSVMAIQQHWVDCLTYGRDPETSGDDNVRTLGLVFDAYESAKSGLPYQEGDGTDGR
jgi:predicted dehydrogenase